MSDPIAHYRIFPLGEDAILIRFGDDRSTDPMTALAQAGHIRAAAISGVTEIASSLASVQVRFAPDVVNRAALTARLKTLLAKPRTTTAAPQTRIWTIPACFDGPQLPEVAALTNLTPDAAIAEVTGTALSVLAIGFAPGQPYLGLLPPPWGFERQTVLTPQVPAGALVVALRQVVLFANPSPTGWRWVGTCAFRPFVADRAEPVALRAGDRIRFVATDAGSLADLHAAPDGLGGATCQERVP
jgi:KipI family sensor histidine kinase inhibitor